MLWLNLFIIFVVYCSLMPVNFAESPPEHYEPPSQEKHVYVLTNENFDDFIKYHDVALVEFYAPWCGHCKSLEPEYAKAAEQLEDHDPVVSLAKVDATEQKDIASRFDVNGYPTLKFFIRGKAHDYDGPRQSDGIVEFMKTRAAPDWKPPPEAVVKLTADNFHDIVDKEDLMLVEFYAPWCGHCKTLAPKYEKAAQTLASNDPPIRLAKLDATEANEIAKEYGITGYPTLKLFRKGRVSDYKGGHQEEHEIVTYMTGQVGDGSRPLASLADVKKNLGADDVTIVAFFDNRDDPRFAVYLAAANDLREDFNLFHTFAPEARKYFRVSDASVVAVHAERFHTEFESKHHHVDLVATTTSADVQAFITQHQNPLVGHYTHTNSAQRYKMRPLCLVFYTIDWSYDHRAATQLWRKKVAAVAKDYPAITFAILDDEQNEALLKEFGLLDSGEDLNVGILGPDDHKFPMAPMEEFDGDSIREFLDDYTSGKLRRLIKSQPTPKKQEGPVTVVVGNTFESIVQGETKDVLVMFYAPWCGHCKQLMPVFKKLAKKLQSEKNLVIAKIDSTANDVPAVYKVEGFPTLYYVSGVDPATPIKYDGPRDLDGLEKYVRKQATVSFAATGSVKEEL